MDILTVILWGQIVTLILIVGLYFDIHYENGKNGRV